MSIGRILGVAAVLTAMCGAPAMATLETATGKSEIAAAKTVTTASGLKYIDVKVGSGELAVTGSRVTVHYTGTLENGKTFDSSLGSEPFSFVVGYGEVIPGWDEGVKGMKVGGKRKLIIPPRLGYGAGGAGEAVPPNATLLFDVELLDIEK